MSKEYTDQIVFKGGTSLEKLRIIKRFSEDLDILVIGNYGSDKASKKALKAMCLSAASATGSAERDPKSGGTTGAFHRRSYLEPPLTHGTSAASAIADSSAVLLELGQSGGPNPTITASVQSLLSRQLQAANFDTDEFEDLTAFEVSILHPGRTLLEKLLRVNNFTSDPDGAGIHGWPRIGRQLYDIWALLGNSDVLELLANSSLVSEILESCYEVSEAFTPDRLPPKGGFANCLAFDENGPHAKRLKEEHDRAMSSLYYGTDQPPSFTEVLVRIKESEQLLSCGA